MLSLPPVAFRHADREYTLVFPCPASDILYLLSLDRQADCNKVFPGCTDAEELPEESRQPLEYLLALNPALLAHSVLRFREQHHRSPESLSETADWLDIDRAKLLNELSHYHSMDHSNTEPAMRGRSIWKRPLKRFLRERNPVKRLKFLRLWLQQITTEDWAGGNHNPKRKRGKKRGPSPYPSLTLRVVIPKLSTVIAEKSTSPADDSGVAALLVDNVLADFFQVSLLDSEDLPKRLIKRAVRNWKDDDRLRPVARFWLSQLQVPETERVETSGTTVDHIPILTRSVSEGPRFIPRLRFGLGFPPGQPQTTEAGVAVAEPDHFERCLLQAKMSALQQLAYGASHEINNPLANIASRAQTLIENETDLEKRAKLAIIYEQAIRTHEMISDLMLFANPPQPHFEVVDLREFLCELNRQVLATLDEKAESSPSCRIPFRIRIAPGLSTVECDPKQLTVALRALIRNSIESIQGSSQRKDSNQIELRVDRPTQDSIRFSVTDTGPGVPASIQSHLFDPFFSGREAGRGLGFGLSKAWRIAQNHGGNVLLDPDYSPGAKFDFILGRTR